MASRITSFTIVYSTVYSGAAQRKHQSSASLASVRGIHRWPVNYPHKGPVTRKMFQFASCIFRLDHSNPWDVTEIINLFCSIQSVLHCFFTWCSSIFVMAYGACVGAICVIILQHWAMNSSPLGQNNRHFADDLFRSIFVNEKFYCFY